MLIPDQMVEVKINNKNIKHYQSLGYECYISYKNPCTIIIPAKCLTIGIHVKVNIQCDICGKIIEKEYKAYLHDHTNGYDTCTKCKTVKSTQTCLEKYNVKNVMHLQENKDKIKATNLERYGTENVSGLSQFQEKRQNTCIERFGVNNPIRNEKIKEKTRQTNIERYGVASPLSYKPFREKGKETNLLKYGYEYPTQSNIIKNKIKETNIEKYGVENIFQSEEIKEIIKQINLDKYGVEYISQSEEIKNKVKETCLKNFGVEYGLQSEEIKEKGRQTCLIKYGVDSPMKLEYFREIANQTLVKNGTCKTSSQQIELYKIIQEVYPDAIINYPCSRSIFDIALLISDKIKIDIEYDCWYWHNQERDKRRDYYHMGRGWKILRIKSGMKLPTKEELFEAIDYLINTEHHHREIFLEDWKESNKETSA
jgi:hypothetical protein